MFTHGLNSRSTVEFFGSDQSIDQDIDFYRFSFFYRVIGRVLVCLSRFLEVHHSTTAGPIRFKLGTMINYKLNSRSTVEFFGSDQSIDQDIDFRDRPCISMSVTLFTSSPFNEGASDSVQTWSDV